MRIYFKSNFILVAVRFVYFNYFLNFVLQIWLHELAEKKREFHKERKKYTFFNELKWTWKIVFPSIRQEILE